MSKSSYLRLMEIDYNDPRQWGERCLFWGMKNADIRVRTAGQFIGGHPEGTHPVFILRKVENDSFEVCPCSSQQSNKDTASYIRKNSLTPPEKRPTDKNSFVLHFYPFNLHLDDRLTDRMPLRGIVAEEDIVGDFHKRGGSIGTGL